MIRLTSFALMIFASTFASAAIVYNVDRSIGDATITGFIETDGTLGAITNASITSYSLTFQSPTHNNGNAMDAVAFSTNGLEATSSNLFFDFSGTTNGMTIAQFNKTNGSPWGFSFWCLDGANSFCSGEQNAEWVGFSDNNAGTAFTNRAGLVSIASTTTVPAPAPFFVLGFGLFLIGARLHSIQNTMVLS